MNHFPKSYPGAARRTRSAALLVALFWCALNGVAAIPAPEKLLPDDTLAVVTVPDFARMREIYKTSPQTRLWTDPAMKPFRDKFLAKLNEELVQPLERELGVHFDDYTNLLQGQLTLAVTQNGWSGASGQSPAVLLLLDARDKRDQLKKNLADLRKKWVDAGKPIKSEKIRNVEFSVLPLSPRDVPQTLRKLLAPGAGDDASDDSATNQSPKAEVVIGQFESLLIAGNSTRAVEKVVAHLTGGAAPSLAEQAAFEANRLALFRDAPVYGWANARAFLDVVSRTPSDEDSDTPNPMAMFSPARLLAATGLNGLKTLAFAFRNSSDGSLFEFFAGAPEAGRQGLLKILPLDGKPSGPPPFVPADVVKFQRCRIDCQKAWATLQSVLNEISPQLTGSLDFLLDSANKAAQEKDPDFDVKKNLFGNLGDDLITYQKAPRGSTPADLNTAPSLFLLGSPQPEQLAAALKSVLVLMSRQAGSPTEREFLGRKIYSVPLPPLRVPTSGDPSQWKPRLLNYAASSGYVALSTDASILEEYLRSSGSQQKALRETPGFVDATARVGGTSSGWFGYENQAEGSRFLVEALRKQGGAGTNDTGSVSGPDTSGFGESNGFKDWMDFSLLPPFDKIARYFYFTVYSAGANMNGITFKMFAPVPPGLRK